MNAMQSKIASSKRGGERSTGPKPGSGKRDTVSSAIDAGYTARENAMLEAMVAYSQPGDVSYSLAMEHIYDLVNAMQALHLRMVESYDDSLFEQAAKFARLTAECGYALSDCHGELASALEKIVPYKSHAFDGVHPHDRNPSNASDVQRSTRDRFIDEPGCDECGGLLGDVSRKIVPVHRPECARRKTNG